jgi:fibronectin-binding autotransporter adhesin
MRRSIQWFGLGMFLLLALAWPAGAQTWTGAALNGGNWNTAANWANPSQVPNSSTADVVFAPTAVSNFVGVGSAFQVRSLTFASATNNYMIGPIQVSGQMLTSLQTITVADNVTTTQTIDLPTFASGSLLFTGTGPAALTIANNVLGLNVAFPTLLIGPNTVLGTPGSGGITVTGTGTTAISGSFASGGNQVLGGLTKAGPGALTLSGNGANLFGGLTLAGGTLRLDYTTNTASKLGSGGLRSPGGDLLLVPHASTAITQNVVSTTLTAGHTQINASAGANVTIGVGAITRSAGATLDLSPGGANLFATTSTGTTNGLLGAGPAFATVGGQFWATSSGGSLGAITTGDLNGYGSGINTDVGNTATLNGPLISNSLRFVANGLTLNLSGTLTLQSGGILLPSNVSTATITGGTLASSQNELIAHVYGSDLTIGSAINVSNGLTKTGPGILTLAGFTFGVGGPVNVNRGDLRVTNSFAINALTAINFNDARGSGQRFYFQVGDNTNAATYADIRLSAYSAPGTVEANVFTGASANSLVTLGGVIASAPGAVTPLRFSNFSATSGFNLNRENTFTGTVRLDGGTLGINSNASLGNPANALILFTSTSTAGGLEFLNGGIDVARPVTIKNSARVVSNGVDVNTISGPVTGGTLVKAGTGTLVLTNAGNAGTRDIRGGTLRVAAGALGTTGDLTLGDGATLVVTGTDTFGVSRSLVLGSVPGLATATIDAAANQTFTVAAVVANGVDTFGALLKTGAGTLALTGPANTYTGGTVVRAGTVQAAADGSLGLAAAPVTVEVGGRLTYTATTSTARTFTMPGGTLEAAAGATVSMNGASVAGGFLRGSGAFNISGGTALTGVTTLTSTTISQTGPASVTNFSNGGSFTVAPGQALGWNGGTNTSSGRLTVNGTASVSDFVSDGQVNIPSGGALNNSGAALVLGGGSRTTINPSGTLAAAAGTSIEVNGGLLVNNGTISGKTNVHFNGQAVGSGTYGAVNIFENGRFAPGASASPAVFSPAVVAASQASFAVNASLAVEIGGVSPGSGYDRLSVSGPATLAGTLEITAANAFVPGPLAQFQVVNSSGRSGVFTHYQGITAPNGLAYAPRYSATDLTLVATLFGDSNFDGSVDFLDLAALAQSYNTTIAGSTDNWWMRGDFNLDGMVDFLDLARLAQNYNTALPPSAAGLPPDFARDVQTAFAAVPEPSSVLLSVVGAALLLSRRRQRKHA